MFKVISRLKFLPKFHENYRKKIGISTEISILICGNAGGQFGSRLRTLVLRFQVLLPSEYVYLETM